MSEKQGGPAIVLRAIPYGDADSVVTLLTRDHGRVAAFAKAARSSRRPRFGAALEPFTLVDVDYRRRGASADLVSLSRADVIDAHGAIRKDLDRITGASYAVEVAREGTREGEDAGVVFTLLGGHLRAICERGAQLEDRAAFELAMLAALGFRPDLAGCMQCARDESSGLRFALSATAGGLLCEDCAGGPDVAGLSPGTVRSLRDVAGTIPPARPPVGFTTRVREELRDLLPAYMEGVLGRGLKTRAFL